MATSKEQKLKRAADYAAKAEKLKAEVKALEQRQAALAATRKGEAKRKAETTAKILIGAAILAYHRRLGEKAQVAAHFREVITPGLNERDRKRLREALETLELIPPLPAPQPTPENAPTARAAPPAVKPTPSLQTNKP